MLSDERLLAPSRLRDWSRLTIACHLRYGAAALTRMTRDALAGRPTAYYPDGRSSQRDGTLVPGIDETPSDVVESLALHSEALHDAWRDVDDWDVEVREPADNHDLGTLPLSRLAIARLTEVEVHGTDLDLGLREWSATFVATALPFRLEWLNTRRSNHRSVDASVQGSWLLAADEGVRYLVRVDGDRVTARPVGADADADADAVIEGPSRDLLALLLGRDAPALRVAGDVRLARAFSRAFPGP